MGGRLRGRAWRSGSTQPPPTPTRAPTNRLVRPKRATDKSCPRITPIVTKRQLREALLGKNKVRMALGASATALSSGAWGPIYSQSSLSQGSPPNNNTGAVGTGYNILVAGAAMRNAVPWLGSLDADGFAAWMRGVSPGIL